MSNERQEEKVSTIFSLGAFIENDLERCKKEMLGLEGTKQALYAIINKFEEYVRVIDSELEKHEITMSESRVAKRHIVGCINIIKDFSRIAEMQLTQTQGKISMCDKFVTDFKKMWDEEMGELKKAKESAISALQVPKKKSRRAQ